MLRDIQRFIYNLGVIRLRWPPPADFDFKANLRWRDLIYCAPNVLNTIIKMKLNGEFVPAGVVLVGGPITREDEDWAGEVAERLGVGTRVE